MQDELASHEANGTWTLVPLPMGRKAIGCRWVFKLKKGPAGEILRYKARLVAKGYSQERGRDYYETFSPVASLATFRVFLAIAAQERFTFLNQMDVVTAFLNGTIEEEVYMAQPPSFRDPRHPDLVCKLQKAIYGLKQAGRVWYQDVSQYIVSLGFTQLRTDHCLFSLRRGDIFILILLYVDDVVVGGNCLVECLELKRQLMAKYRMTDGGELNWFLGMHVVLTPQRICLDQTQYICNVLERFGMADCSAISTPAERKPLAKSTTADPEMVNTPYREAVGALLYASNGTRPDIQAAVSRLCRFTECPTREHWLAVKRVFRYLQGTKDACLTFECTGDTLQVVGHADADWGGDISTRRSTTGFVFHAAGGPVVWKSKLQRSVAKSTAEAEYMAVSEAASMATWLRMLLGEVGVTIPSVLLFTDNNACLAMAKNTADKSRCKHIALHYHYVKDEVTNGVLELKHKPTALMVASFTN
jgi:hypothetical protein